MTDLISGRTYRHNVHGYTCRLLEMTPHSVRVRALEGVVDNDDIVNRIVLDVEQPPSDVLVERVPIQMAMATDYARSIEPWPPRFLQW
jgi:hypothetical protein